jgi:hypothetical protein
MIMKRQQCRRLGRHKSPGSSLKNCAAVNGVAGAGIAVVLALMLSACLNSVGFTAAPYHFSLLMRSGSVMISNDSGQFFANQGGDDFGGGLVERFRLGADILRRHLVKGGKQIALPGEKPALSMLQGRRGFGPKLVEGVRFFFGHSCHYVS